MDTFENYLDLTGAIIKEAILDFQKGNGKIEKLNRKFYRLNPRNEKDKVKRNHISEIINNYHAAKNYLFGSTEKSLEKFIERTGLKGELDVDFIRKQALETLIREE